MKDINLFPDKGSIYLKKISSKSQIESDDKFRGYLIESSEKEARRVIDYIKGENKVIAFVGGEDSLNRRAIETLKIDYLASPEKNCDKDTLKQRDSGLNHYIVKEAARKNITIVINMLEFSRLSKKEKALRASRIIQNIKICRKANCKIKIASFAIKKEEVFDEISRESFGKSLGMSTDQMKESILF